MRDPRRGPRSLSKWTPMADHQLQLDPRSEEADERASSDLRDPASPLPRSPAFAPGTPRLAAAGQAVQEEIPEGQLRPATIVETRFTAEPLRSPTSARRGSRS